MLGESPTCCGPACSTSWALRLQPLTPLSDMAADAIGVLDALGVRQAHVVGVSMGGMMRSAWHWPLPQRVLSLTSIMSSRGAKGLPGPPLRCCAPC